MKTSKTLTYFLLMTFIGLLAGCSSDDDASGLDDNLNPDGYDVVAHLEFSSGESMDFKANSVIPFNEPFIYDETTGHRILTSGYQITIEDLIYRLDIKAIVKDEPGSYSMYENSNDYLETLGFYMEFTVTNVAGTGSIDDLYRTQNIDAESGSLEITSVTNDRLQGNFSALLPYMPLEDGKNVQITNGKIDIAITWMNE